MKGVIDLKTLPVDARRIIERCCDPNPETRAMIDEVVKMHSVNVSAKCDNARNTMPNLKSRLIGKPIIGCAVAKLNLRRRAVDDGGCMETVRCPLRLRLMTKA